MAHSAIRIAAGAGVVAASLLIAVGDLRSPLFVGVAAAIVNIALAFALVPQIDAVGAAIASVGAQAVGTALLFRVAVRRLGPGAVRWQAGHLGRQSTRDLGHRRQQRQ